jgi:dynein heavy chain
VCAAFLLLPAAPPSTQYKTVLDALRGRKERFTFEDVEIGLKPSVMAFITMNPGYPGRAGALLTTVCMYRHVVSYALCLVVAA